MKNVNRRPSESSVYNVIDPQVKTAPTKLFPLLRTKIAIHFATIQCKKCIFMGLRGTILVAIKLELCIFLMFYLKVVGIPALNCKRVSQTHQKTRTTVEVGNGKVHNIIILLTLSFNH